MNIGIYNFFKLVGFLKQCHAFEHFGRNFDFRLKSLQYWKLYTIQILVWKKIIKSRYSFNAFLLICYNWYISFTISSQDSIREWCKPEVIKDTWLYIKGFRFGGLFMIALFPMSRFRKGGGWRGWWFFSAWSIKSCSIRGIFLLFLLLPPLYAFLWSSICILIVIIIF